MTGADLAIGRNDRLSKRSNGNRPEHQGRTMNWSRFSGQLSGSARTGAWLAEVGRWQDDAMQVTAFSDGKITA